VWSYQRVTMDGVSQTLTLVLTVNVTLATAAVSVTYVRQHFYFLIHLVNWSVFGLCPSV